eukprot:m51a1_g5363 putative diacylglycerol kinase gamma (476) ;mRNA; f:504635-506971
MGAIGPAPLQPHVWVAGRRVAQGPCALCARDVAGDDCDAACACVWCARVAHDACCCAAPGACDLGPLGPLLAAPRLVGPAGLLADDDAGAGGAATTAPLVVLVNLNSGARQGQALVTRLRSKLNPLQVFDLERGPGPALEWVRARGSAFRVLVCGGDGTAIWVLQALRAAGLDPPVATLPLGTGNDLSRALGWGGGYTGGSLRRVLAAVARAAPERIDLWRLAERREGSEGGEQQEQQRCLFSNYFSVGIDASVALRFHRKRERDKEAFDNRVGNKVAYVVCGVEDFFSRARPLHPGAALEVDGRQVDLRGLQGVSLVNIRSAHAGKNLWGTPGPKSHWAPSDHSDGLIEVAAIETYMTLPVRLAQGREVRFTLSGAGQFPAQYDGEPFVLETPVQLSITRAWQAAVLRAPSDHTAAAASATPATSPPSKSPASLSEPSRSPAEQGEAAEAPEAPEAPAAAAPEAAATQSAPSAS